MNYKNGIGLIDYDNLAHRSLITSGGGRLNHVNTTGNTLSFKVGTVPDKGASVAPALSHQDTVGRDNLHIGVESKSGNGDRTSVAGLHRVWIGIGTSLFISSTVAVASLL